jgi:hypothetical protein
MASYTSEQLYGKGVEIEAISKTATKTFTLTNPASGSSYFTIETVKNYSGSYHGQSTNALGSYSSFSSISADTLKTSSFIASVVVPEGGGSFTFSPTDNIAVSSSMLRATGGITLVIS